MRYNLLPDTEYRTKLFQRISSWEDNRTIAYVDGKGFATIGVGVLIEGAGSRLRAVLEKMGHTANPNDPNDNFDSFVTNVQNALRDAITAKAAGEPRLREETRAGLFPLRLTPEDWASGGNHRLPRVIAPNPRSAPTVTGNINQAVKDRRMKLHTGNIRLPDAGRLKRLRTGDRVRTWRSTQGETPVNGGHEGGGDA